MKLLQNIQNHLENLYALETQMDVSQFVINGQSGLVLQEHFAQRGESLLIREVDDDVEIALYLDQKSLDRLNKDGQITTANLRDFFLTTEGVSHFLLVVHRGQQDKETSQVELELQGEVDKFLAVVLRMEPLKDKRAWEDSLDEIIRALFEIPLLEDLSAEEAERYAVATRLARRYCMHLCEKYLRHRRYHELIQEARRFYRLGLWDKLLTIARIH